MAVEEMEQQQTQQQKVGVRSVNRSSGGQRIACGCCANAVFRFQSVNRSSGGQRIACGCRANAGYRFQSVMKRSSGGQRIACGCCANAAEAQHWLQCCVVVI
eukprot:1118794-Pelagomonas_calceolata.AAC.1